MEERPPTEPESEGGDPFDDLYAGTGENDVPPEDWSQRYGNGAKAPPPPPRQTFDPGIFLSLLEALRRASPPELQDRITALIREFLLTLRSLIDWYLERLDDDGPREPEVEDIPID